MLCDLDSMIISEPHLYNAETEEIHIASQCWYSYKGFGLGQGSSKFKSPSSWL